jgi:hypothetical protein
VALSPCLQHPQNTLCYSIQIAQHLVVPEANHPPSLLFQPSGPLQVSVVVGMLTAIDLDRQPMLEAGEIEDERTDWMLTPEFVVLQLPPAENRPKAPFGIGHLDPQLARFATGHWSRLT